MFRRGHVWKKESTRGDEQMRKNSARHIHKKSVFIFVLTMLFAASFSLQGCGQRTTKISIGTAGVGGNYYSFGRAYAQVLMQDIKDTDVQARVTTGSGANLRMLTSQEAGLDLAIVQSDLLAQSTVSKGPASDNTPGVKAIAGMYIEAVQIVVRRDSGIETVSDLRGKLISVGEAESGTESDALMILRASGLGDGMYTMRNLNYGASVQALAEGKIDAFFCTMGVPMTAIATTAKKVPLNLVSLSDKEVDKVTAMQPWYVPCTIPAGTYNGMDRDVHTIGVKAVLVASGSLSEDLVKRITGSLFDHADELQYSVTVNYKPDPAEAVKDLPIPLHDGAKAWYREKGIEVPNQ
jgi:TRAP transporter TAXI family solute receptor